MADAVRGFRDRFDEIVGAHEDWNEALIAVLVDGFDLTDQNVLKLRVMLVEHGRAALPRDAAARGSRAGRRPRAEARARVRLRGVLRPWHAAGSDPRERPATSRPGRARPLQQRLAVVPARRDASRSPTSAASTSAASSRSSAPTQRLSQTVSRSGLARSRRAAAIPDLPLACPEVGLSSLQWRGRCVMHFTTHEFSSSSHRLTARRTGRRRCAPSPVARLSRPCHQDSEPIRRL